MPNCCVHVVHVIQMIFDFCHLRLMVVVSIVCIVSSDGRIQHIGEMISSVQYEVKYCDMIQYRNILLHTLHVPCALLIRL